MNDDSSESSFVGFEVTGTYSDSKGAESVVFRFVPIERMGPLEPPRFEIRAVIRGFEWRGGDFDCLQPSEGYSALQESFERGDISAGALTWSLPIHLRKGGALVESIVEFRLDQANGRHIFDLRVAIGGETFAVRSDDGFEHGFLQMEKLMSSSELGISACFTCLYSDYSPMGNGFSGMQCHRNAKEHYLSVQSKAEYWSVPVTETVFETHRCAEWTERIPGTGYRG